MSEIDDFRYSLDSELSRSSISRSEKDDISNDVKGLEDAVSQFEGKFQRRRESADDVSDILEAAKYVNDFVTNRRYGTSFQTDWTNVRNLLDRLSRELIKLIGDGTAIRQIIRPITRIITRQIRILIQKLLTV